VWCLSVQSLFWQPVSGFQVSARCCSINLVFDLICSCTTATQRAVTDNCCSRRNMELQRSTQPADVHEQRQRQPTLRRSILVVKGSRRQQRPSGAETGQQLQRYAERSQSVVGGGSRRTAGRWRRRLYQRSQQSGYIRRVLFFRADPIVLDTMQSDPPDFRLDPLPTPPRRPTGDDARPPHRSHTTPQPFTAVGLKTADHRRPPPTTADHRRPHHRPPHTTAERTADHRRTNRRPPLDVENNNKCVVFC